MVPMEITILIQLEKRTLRTARPEENVRQQFIKFLIDCAGVPLDHLISEDAISHHGAASRQRMDISCKVPNDKTPPLFIVECKQKGLALETEQNRNQVQGYADHVYCRLAILTNGEETYIYKADNDKWFKLHLPKNTVPTYQEMLDIGEYEIQIEPPPSWHRPAWKKLPNSAKDLRGDPFASMVSTGSGRDRIRWLASFGSLLLDVHSAGKWRKFKINVEDKGVARVSPTNRSGGRWTGEYRGFLVTQDDADPHMVRFAMMPDWKEGTTLVVAVDDENGKTCNQLQLDMDFRDTVEQSGETAIIWHNGKLPGSKGWTKAALIDYVRKHTPRLVKGEYVRLGEIPINRHVEWQDAHKLITNCIEYALLRKQFKDGFGTRPVHG